jgi:hypothetical protein
MRLMPIGGALLGLALAFAAVTVIALEGHEVVVLRTRGTDGDVKETRTWIADEAGASFIEAAHADRPFYQHLLVNSEVEVVRAGAVRTYRATPVQNPAGQAHIRRRLAERYGWADTWVGVLQDTAQSIEVRLDPTDGTRGVATP